MKIRELRLNRFKRFSDLRVTGIPETARLVVLVGPNGCGKTSLFEALNHWYKLNGFNNRGDQTYGEKKDGTTEGRRWFQNRVTIDCHGDVDLAGELSRGKFYFRSAYRNEPDFTTSGLGRQLDPTQSIKLNSLMDNDQVVSENYQRLVSRTLLGVYDESNDTKSVEQLRNELIGKLKSSLANVFDDLNVSDIGDPLLNGSFYFEKGASKDFHYKNLSAGEKSVFDLVLDMVVKSSYYSDAVFCIDEPEAHMHTRLQGKVLNELYSLTPASSQLWIATHSIGMLKKAEEIEGSSPGTVVFLDFDNRDFDLPEVISPTTINKAVWDRFFDLALADFSALVAPARIVFCEGTQAGRKYQNFDAQIYEQIFMDSHPDTVFVSLGSCTDVEDIGNTSVTVVSHILKSSQIIKFIDRDNRSPTEVSELLAKGIKVSRKRNIESYLLDDKLIEKLCDSVSQSVLLTDCLSAKEQALRDSIARGNAPDDIKSASGQIFTELKRILGLTSCGNNKCAFLRDTMCPLITAETSVYKELDNEIFGGNQ